MVELQIVVGSLWKVAIRDPRLFSEISRPVAACPTDTEAGDQRQWYFDEMNTVYGANPPVIVADAPCGDFLDVRTTVLNQGIPLGLYTVDEAIAALDAKQCPAP